jgi:hypothetical protein
MFEQAKEALAKAKARPAPKEKPAEKDEPADDK